MFLPCMQGQAGSAAVYIPPAADFAQLAPGAGSAMQGVDTMAMPYAREDDAEEGAFDD